MTFSLVSDIITQAYREINVTAIGAAPTANQQSEALSKLNRGIKSVLGMELGETLKDWPAPQPQRTAPFAANYPQAPYPFSMDPVVMPFPIATPADEYVWPYPPKNSRIVWGGNEQTVWFPEAPDNGSRMGLIQGSGAGDRGQGGDVLTLDGNGRYINAPGTDTVEYTFNTVTPFSPVLWIYIADTGVWTPLSDLSLTSSLPFSERYDDYWIIGLAIRIAPSYNKTVSAESLKRFQQMDLKVRAEFRQSSPTVYGSFEFPRALESYIAGRWFY